MCTGEVMDVEAYKSQRHQRAMVRLCALLWVAQLQRDELVKREHDTKVGSVGCVCVCVCVCV